MRFFVHSLTAVLFALCVLSLQGCFSNKECLSFAPEIRPSETTDAFASPQNSQNAKDSAALASSISNNTSSDLVDINGQPLDVYKSSKTEDPDKPLKTAAIAIGITTVSILTVLLLLCMQASPGLGD